MRIGETISLTVDAIDINRRAILIPQDITKGRKDRYLETQLIFCIKIIK